MKIEEKKKMGPKGKMGDGPARWVNPLYAHNENDYLVWRSPAFAATTARKKESNMLRA